MGDRASRVWYDTGADDPMITVADALGNIETDVTAAEAAIADLESSIYTEEVTVASAATTDIGGAVSLRVLVTGTTGITSFGTEINRLRIVRFDDVLTITHHGTSLVLPGSVNMTTAAGDILIALSDASGNWRVLLQIPTAGNTAYWA
jgi:hypothetical protein